MNQGTTREIPDYHQHHLLLAGNGIQAAAEA